MEKTKPLQIFKPGTHTAMSGATLAFSEPDLAASAAAYDPARFEAPIVVGHPRLDAPAYGWVKALSFADGALEAVPQQVDPAFADMVEAGRFKKISASFFAPNARNNPAPGVYYLRHVGFLGAQAPAVQGLRTPEFAADGDGVVSFEFSEYDDITVASLFRSMRDWFIGKFGQDEADRVLPAYQVQALEQSAQDELREAMDEAANEGGTESPPISPSFSTPTDPTPTQETVKDTAMTPEQKAALEAENAQLKQRLADAEAATKALAMQQANAANVVFAEGLIAEGKLLPAERAVVTATMALFAESSPSFADGDGTEKPLLEGFKGFLSALPKRIEFGEFATNERAGSPDARVEFAAPAGYGVDAEALATHQKALAYQAEHKTDYLTAIRAVAQR